MREIEDILKSLLSDVVCTEYVNTGILEYIMTDIGEDYIMVAIPK